ncbi:MAG: beta-N-acetylhexosaminidase [Bacteroidales bacterium]
MKKFILSLFIFSSLLGASSCQDKTNDYTIIPAPQSLMPRAGNFKINDKVVFINEGLDSLSSLVAEKFITQINQNSDFEIQKVSNKKQTAPSVWFQIDSTRKKESYKLDVSNDHIKIQASDASGFYYAIQTLTQLFPDNFAGENSDTQSQWLIPCVTITDEPRFSYRGSMLDVGRYFMPKEFVLKYIDQLAYYKMNRLHLHLTEDQGWRLEIKRYPELTQTGSKRPHSQIGHSDHSYPFVYDSVPHGGFFTQDDIREIVKYASDRFIEVIPEIEMPGHASAALATYPQLSCGLESEYYVQGRWDVFDQVYCPQEQTFEFLQNVLDEVIELFPSKYIHIGGDECPKKAWAKCPHCQKRIKDLGLKDEHELQSYFITRMEKYLNSKGRDIIGWDEILEGGLAPNATVMSWRGEKGGIEAAKMKHNVIMSPGEYCYFDFYQEDPEYAPLSIGGFVSLEKAYSYDPLPKELSDEEKKYIIGAQANMWTEYIPDTTDMEYMAFPRLVAFSEVLWTNPENKDFGSFCKRLEREFPRMEKRGLNACRNFYDVNFTVNTDNDGIALAMHTYLPDAKIHYTIDGSEPTKTSPVYTKPLRPGSSATIKALVFKDGEAAGSVKQKNLTIHKATGLKYTTTPVYEWAERNGNTQLTDGILGYTKTLGEFVGFIQDSTEIELKWDNPANISKVALRFLNSPLNDIYLPAQVILSASKDGVSFTQIAGKDLVDTEYTLNREIYPLDLTFNADNYKTIRILLTMRNAFRGNLLGNNKPEIALDEIVVE